MSKLEELVMGLVMGFQNQQKNSEPLGPSSAKLNIEEELAAAQ